MTVAHIRLALRIVGACVVAFAVIAGVRGGLSFTAQPETVSSDTYVIRHTVILPHSFIAVAMFGLFVFASSFLIGSRASGTRTI